MIAFLKKHLPPTLQNAAGTLLAAVICVALTTAIVALESLRAAIFSALLFPVPVYLVLLLLALAGSVIVKLVKDLRAAKSRARELEAALAQQRPAQRRPAAKRSGWVDGWRR